METGPCLPGVGKQGCKGSPIRDLTKRPVSGQSSSRHPAPIRKPRHTDNEARGLPHHLRDFGLMLAALVLARLAWAYPAAIPGRRA